VTLAQPEGVEKWGRNFDLGGLWGGLAPPPGTPPQKIRHFRVGLDPRYVPAKYEVNRRRFEGSSPFASNVILPREEAEKLLLKQEVNFFMLLTKKPI
jgi:hypothetical protein